MAEYQEQQVSEATGGKLAFAWYHAPTVLRWLAVAVVLAGAPIYLAYRPEDYTPLVETLLNVFLFLLAYWIGYKQESARAAQQANDRWLPQAESVIFRLLTLHANVRRFSIATQQDCRESECDLPELKKDDMRAVRVKLKTECEASSRRLDDIAHQLEDAIEDWRRFITANCVGEECLRIFEALQQREQKLLSGVPSSMERESPAGQEPTDAPTR